MKNEEKMHQHTIIYRSKEEYILNIEFDDKRAWIAIIKIFAIYLY